MKTWYVAHVVMSVRALEGDQDEIPIWENVRLILASSFDDAAIQAQLLAEEDAHASSEGLQWGGRPSRMVFEGIRKIMEVLDCSLNGVDPRSGTEVTFSEYTVTSDADVKLLVDGKAVTLTYVE